MDGEAEIVSGCTHRENKRSYKDFLMDVEDLEEAGSDAEEHSTKMLHQEQSGSLNKNIPPIGSSGIDHKPHGADVSSFLHEYPVCVSQDRWTVRGEERIQENLLHPCFNAEGNISLRSPGPMMEYLVYLNSQHYGADCPSNGPASPAVSPVGNWPRHSTPIPSSLTAISTTVSSMMTSFMTDSCSPIGFICGVTTSATDPLMSTPKSLCCSDQDPASAAAYLHLLGESLSLIGHHLQETDKMVCMSSSLSLLLDSLLCAMAPLTGLTMHIPELRSCTQHTLASTLDNIAYVMPGL
ncbi:uncharacterized protein LOC102302067 [Haplochromis burtoni]|uniref:uncharacterized protein LOC102302067 n=1 Tax=Haplochromis burtoni TaxID=8153 RepID=UPI0003BD5EC8|nr:uncharacterized protein LOC102302067 [Haplochromis burtoni]